MKRRWNQPSLPDLVCPVTGRAYETRAEWVQGSDHHTYRVGVLDRRIVMCQSFGRSNGDDVRGYCRMMEAILREFHRPGEKLVLLEDYTHLSGTDDSARQPYVEFHLRNQDILHGILFFGLNPFLKLVMRLSRRALPLRFEVEALSSYGEALEAAFRMLGRDLDVSLPAPSQGVSSWSSPQASVDFHSVDSRGVVRCDVRGRFRREDVAAVFEEYERFMATQKLPPHSFCKVVDYSGLVAADLGAMLEMPRRFNRLDRLFPAAKHVLVGVPNKLSYRIAKIFLAQRDRMVLVEGPPELEAELALFRPDAGPQVRASVFARAWKWLRRAFRRDLEENSVKLMEFIGGLQWDSEAKGQNPYPSDHPFHQVANSLLMVKADFDKLIDDRMRREKELESAREKAEEAKRLQGRFLANVSHEIRTPLNAILGMGEMLSDTHLDAQQTDLLRTMRQSSTGLLTVINDILDLSRMEAGEFRLSAEAFDISNVVEEVGRMMGYLASSKGLEWRVRKLGELPQAVRGDPVRLRQVLLNLAGNAVKFTEKGRVSVEVRRMGGGDGSALLHFRVEDSGPGIPSDRMGELFQPFRQLDGSLSRRHGGTGLGLAIAHNLVRQMGGNLGVESSPSGSVFGFRLAFPLAEPSSVVVVESSSGAAPQQLAGRVLVAEDNRVNQKVALGLLTKLGMDAEVVENGRQAIDELRVRASEYQLVLMDIQMPEMDGVEAVLRIRSGEAGEVAAGIPGVALTAHAMEGDRELFLQQGMDDYLSKPIRLADLRTSLEKWIGERHGRKG